ncbi:ATP-binding protein [Fulvimonas sp. R45]|uniref:ATP-binding protein n=1 Tax=Fulvimonas sp. R45 TaxID=3045937 RepID=UPI00265EB5CA|nr:ATP-binding protein [Fulvimonas sp. R45]MDO1529686.1 ATP-binding protein [Fulvimonas sp. R45]
MAPTCLAALPGALPVRTSIDLLAGLLLFSGLLALGLLRMLWLQRRRLAETERRLQRQAQEIARRDEAARHANAVGETLREITRRIPVVVFAVRRGRGHGYRLTFLAGDLRALFGLERQDLLASDDVLLEWPFQDRVHPEDQDALQRQVRRAVRHAGAVEFDFRAYGLEGLRWVRMILASHREADGETCWTGYFIDTTRLNAHNQSLRAARDAAERASKAKADFLATMSHEIRTPMNGVIGMLELLGHTPLDTDQRELLHAVEDSAGVLLQILNDVLDFSKLEAGNLRLDPAPFDPRVLLDNVVGLAAGGLRRKELDVSLAMDAALAGRLLGDGVRIRQILLNLLGNAGKFTERGGISVSLRVLGDDGDTQRLRLRVEDTGIGIPADKQAGLFSPFAQAESWTARRYGGTGLGLAICRHLVQLMDGEIALASEPGAGTTVTVHLRLPVAQRGIEAGAAHLGRHAVVRLASPALAAALADHLVALGHSVEMIPPDQPLRSGIAANLLFVDADDHASPARIPARVVALDAGPAAPAMPFEGEGRILLAAAPLKWQGVLRACELALAPPARTPPANRLPAATAPAPAAPPTAAPPGHGRILVAEDHPVNQALTRRQLALLGWDCDVVADGRAAYEALCRHDYVLLMTDCQMPGMDGYELAAAWRRHEAGLGRARRLPVIAMTAHALDGEIARCREAGMDDYLSKPVQLRALEEKLSAWLPSGTAAAHAAGDGPPLHGDLRRLLRETGQADLAAIELAAGEDDAPRAAQRLHRLLGALAVFGDDPLLDEGRRLLDALEGDRPHAALRACAASLDDLRRLLERMTGESAAAS